MTHWNVITFDTSTLLSNLLEIKHFIWVLVERERVEAGSCCVSLQSKKAFPCQPGLCRQVIHISIKHLMEGF